MKIEVKKNRVAYYDVAGVEIEKGDTVLMNSKAKVVYLTDDGYLGTDATNPEWIERGWAIPCEFGIYPFSTSDEPILIRKR